METYASVLLIAIPFFIGLMAIEHIYGWLKGNNTFRGMDTVASLSSGYTNILKDVLKLGIAVVSYPFLVKYLALFHLEATWLIYLLSFILIDFAGYCNHRLAHSINYFWNDHIIHHSSEEFNLACALRQPFSNLLSIYAIFLIPAAIIGLPPKIIATIAPIHLFMQFWYHTKHIPKLGWLEYVIVTPSIHRVHHAINPEYMDKNMAQIFSFWDRIFGTYQEELVNVPPVYGVKRPVKTWNPFLINFQHLWLLIKDAWHAQSYWDKMRIWFMPTGWRPADVAAKYPVAVISDPEKMEKFDPQISLGIKVWSWVQLIFTLLMILHLFANFAAIGLPGALLYGGFIFVSIFAYTTLMDGNRHAIWMELLRCAFAIGIVVISGDWFFLDNLFSGAWLIPIGYFVVSSIVVGVLGKQLRP